MPHQRQLLPAYTWRFEVSDRYRFIVDFPAESAEQARAIFISGQFPRTARMQVFNADDRRHIKQGAFLLLCIATAVFAAYQAWRFFHA